MGQLAWRKFEHGSYNKYRGSTQFKGYKIREERPGML